MTSVLERLYDETAAREAQRGDRTGGLSKILSHMGLLLLIFAAAHVVARGEWLAGALVSAGLLMGRLGTLIWVGALAYLTYLHDFWGASALGAAQLIGCVAWWTGFRNARRELLEGATGISPFAGMSTGVSYVIEVVALAMACFTSGVLSLLCWVVFALSILYAAHRYAFRLYPKWCRIHYSLMFRWARFGAQAAACHLDGGRAVDVRPELCDFVESIWPERGQGYAWQLVETADAARSEFSDEDRLRDLFIRRNPRIDAQKLDALMGKLRDTFVTSDDVGLRVRYVIASVIEKDLGLEERTRYLAAIVEGKAT